MNWELLHADCRAVMSNMGDETVDAIVTDPPYHLTSIVKRFGPGSAPQQFGSDGAYARAARGFMGKTWDGGDIAFDSGLWAEALRVLKPGGYLVAFSGTRTYHRMACAIEDAGFEIRDMLEWLYGSGFPKGGVDDEGRGTALKPAHEPMCLARKSFKGSAAACVEAHGTGLLNIDACRIEGEAVKTFERIAGDRSREQCRTGTTLGRPELVDRGRFPANVCHDGSPEVLAAFPETTSGAKVGGQYGRDTGVHGGGATFGWPRVLCRHGQRGSLFLLRQGEQARSRRGVRAPRDANGARHIWRAGAWASRAANAAGRERAAQRASDG